MALNILFGEHANELIDECLEKISAEARLWPQKRAFLLVPEQIKADMERRFLRILNKQNATYDSGFETLMLVDVVSFSRLSHRILSEIGSLSEEYLDDALESMLIHTILRDGGKDFPELSSLSDRIGFVPEIQSVLGDFSRYHVTSERLKAMDVEDVEPGFLAKIHDFALLMERLELRTEQLGFVRAGEDMKRLAEVLWKVSGDHELPWPLNRLSYLRDTSVWIVGFGQLRDFTPEEYTVITGMMNACESVTVAALADRFPLTRTAVSDGSAAFYFGRQTLWNLKKRFPDALIEKSKSVPGKADDLLALSSAYADRSFQPTTKTCGSIYPIRMRDSMEELTFTAGEIRRLVLCEGLRYKDIGVVLCDPKSLEPSLHAVFAEFGLDPFLDKRRPLSDTACIRFVMSLLDLGISGWSFHPLMTCLKSGMCHISPEFVDRFENFCLAYGFFRGYRIFDPKNYTQVNDPGGEMLDMVIRVLIPLQDFVKSITLAETCADKAVALLSFLHSYGGEAEGYLPGVAGQIEALSAEWAAAKDQDAALALTASFNELIVLLEKLSGPIGETKLSLINFKGMLSSGMDAAMYGAIPSYVDQITISDIKRGAQRPNKVVFLVGASSDKFPFGSVREGYLRGYERELLAERLGIFFPSRSRDQYFADYAAAYSLLDSPTDRLYLLCPMTKEPSALFSQIKTMFPELKISDAPELSLHDPRLFSRNALQRYIQAMLAEDGELRGAEYLRAMAEQILKRSEASKTGPSFTVSISEESMRLRYPGELRMSVSQVEAYASCPFKHFSNYVLRLQERDSYEAKPNITGTILHAAMESALKEYMQCLTAAKTAQEKIDIARTFADRDFAVWARDLIDSTQDASREPVAGDPVFRASAGSLMYRTAAHSLRYIFRDPSFLAFEPEALEWQFGETGTPQITVPTKSGRNVLLRGTIDRVDIDHENQTFRVIDYKTGNKEVKYDELFHGLSVQLPIYLKVFSSHRPELSPKQAGYFLVSRPSINISEASGRRDLSAIDKQRDKEYKIREIEMEPDLLEKTADYAVSRIRRHCDRLFSGDFSVSPRQLSKGKTNQACEYCDYMAVCGIDPKRPPVNRLSEIPTLTDARQKKDKENFKAYIRSWPENERDL